MKSIVVVDIAAPRVEVAALYADPRNNAKWMDDIDRCEPLGGDQGMPGSTYRIIPNHGSTGKMRESAAEASGLVVGSETPPRVVIHQRRGTRACAGSPG